MHPRLKWHVLLDFPDGRHALFFGSKAVFLTPTQMTAFKHWRALALYGNSLATSSTSTSAGMSFENFFEWASANDWLTTPFHPTVVSGELATSVIKQALDMWASLANFTPLPKAAMENRVNGWLYLLEKCYFVLKAEYYLRPGSAKIKQLANMLECEKHHATPLLQAIEMTLDEFTVYDPSLLSRLVVSHLHELSTNRPLSLLVSLSLFEADPQRAELVNSFYLQLAQTTQLDLSPFYNHFVQDLAENHRNNWEEALLTCNQVTTQELNIILDDLHTTKHLIQKWQLDQIDMMRNLDPEVRAQALKPKDLVRPKVTIESFDFHV